MWPALSQGKTLSRQTPVGFASEIPIPGLIHLAIFDGDWKLVQILRESQTETTLRTLLFRIEQDPNEEHDLAATHPAVVERLSRLMRAWRRQHPMAGTRGTLVPHPGWVAPRDWAAVVTPAELMQTEWKNEFPFPKQIFDLTSERGVLVDEETRLELIAAEEERLRRLRER
jgi:hypothetical protein